MTNLSPVCEQFLCVVFRVPASRWKSRTDHACLLTVAARYKPYNFADARTSLPAAAASKCPPPADFEVAPQNRVDLTLLYRGDSCRNRAAPKPVKSEPAVPLRPWGNVVAIPGGVFSELRFIVRVMLVGYAPLKFAVFLGCQLAAVSSGGIAATIIREFGDGILGAWSPRL
jgi:hypothetical protein